MDDLFGLLFIVSLAIGMFFGTAFSIAVLLEDRECRKTHNVYQCERIYVPVTTPEDKP